MKLSGWIVGAALAAALVGCGSNPVVAPTMSEAQFVEQARTFGPFAKTPDDSLASSGRELCKAFAPSDGGDAAQLQGRIRGQLTDGGKMTPTEADTLLRYAVMTYCPQEFPYLADARA